MKRETNDKIEFLRAIACLMVICIHVSNCYSRAYGEITEVSYVVSILCNGFCRISVPLFFMISGYLLIPRTVCLQRTMQRAARACGTLVLWSVIYYVWNRLYDGQGYDMTGIFSVPVKRHLWFMYAIVGIYLVLPLLQCMFKDMPAAVMRYFTGLWISVLTADYVLALFEIKIKYEVPIVGGTCYLGYFVMGYLLGRWKAPGRRRSRWCLAGAVVCVLLTVGLTYSWTKQSGIHNEDFFEYRNVLIAAASCLVFYVTMQADVLAIPDWAKRLVTGVSKHSFTIYLCHVLALDWMKHWIAPTDVSAGMGIFLGTAGIFLVSLLFSIVWDGIWGKCRGAVTAGLQRVGGNK